LSSTVAHRPRTRPGLCSSRNRARHRRPSPPRGSRARSGHPSSTKPIACSVSTKQKASGLTCRRAARHELLNTPRKAHHRCWSGAPTGWERAPEDKICDAAAVATPPTSPRNEVHSAATTNSRRRKSRAVAAAARPGAGRPLPRHAPGRAHRLRVHV